jgi:hypothetical protein
MQSLQKRAHKQLIAADFLEQQVHKEASERVHGERPLRLEMSPISKHPKLQNLWPPQLFQCPFRIA